MNYNKLYELSNKFEKHLTSYVIQRNEVSDSFYVAKVFIMDLTEKSNKNEQLRDELWQWLMRGGTLRLKNLLTNTTYNCSNLAHFNAMALIDTVHVSFRH
jgi:uncharacterized membrane protein